MNIISSLLKRPQLSGKHADVKSIVNTPDNDPSKPEFYEDTWDQDQFWQNSKGENEDIDGPLLLESFAGKPGTVHESVRFTKKVPAAPQTALARVGKASVSGLLGAAVGTIAGGAAGGFLAGFAIALGAPQSITLPLVATAAAATAVVGAHRAGTEAYSNNPYQFKRTEVAGTLKNKESGLYFKPEGSKESIQVMTKAERKERLQMRSLPWYEAWPVQGSD